MKTRKLIFLTIGILIVVLSIMSSDVMAFSLREPWTGEIKIKYSNWESIILREGDELYGIGKVTSIEAVDPYNTILWADGDNGEELTAQFGGFIAEAIESVWGVTAIGFTGGWLNVYLDNTPDFNATYPGTGVTDGDLFLSTVGVPGIIPGQDFTLFSIVTQLTSPFTGYGSGYLNITDGDYAGLFVEDVFGPDLDLFLQSALAAPIGGYDGWPVRSEDPITGAIPEPGTIMLLGAGLAGLGFLGRKRLIKK